MPVPEWLLSNTGVISILKCEGIFFILFTVDYLVFQSFWILYSVKEKQHTSTVCLPYSQYSTKLLLIMF